MKIGYLLLGILIFTFAQVGTWFQTNYQFYNEWVSKNIFYMSLLGIPISILYIYSTKYVGIAFNFQLWPIRLIGFAIGIFVFSFLTWKIGGQSLNIKNGVCLALAFIILLHIAKMLYLKYNANQLDAPYLLDGSKNAKNSMVISQNPEHTNYIPINRSSDRDAIEFSYQFWYLLNDMSYKKGEWKHIFHKGNVKAHPHRAPGVFIHPDKHSLRVYMNTQHNILEYLDIDGLFHCGSHHF